DPVHARAAATGLYEDENNDVAGLARSRRGGAAGQPRLAADPSADTSGRCRGDRSAMASPHRKRDRRALRRAQEPLPRRLPTRNRPLTAAEYPTGRNTMKKNRFRAAAAQTLARLGDVQYNIEISTQLVNEAVRQGAELVVLPECMNTGYLFDSADHCRALAE